MTRVHACSRRRAFFGFLLLAVCAAGLPRGATAVELREGDLVLSNPGNAALVRFDPTTGAVDVITSGDVGSGIELIASDVALGPDDALYTGAGTILRRIDPRTGDRTFFEAASAGSIRNVAHRSADRSLWTASSLTAVQLDAAGNAVNFFPFGDPAIPLLLGGFLVTEDAAYATGRVGIDRAILRYSLPDGPGVVLTLTTNLFTDLALGSDGTLYALDDNSVLLAVEGTHPSGLPVVSGPGRGSGPALESARGLLVDASGTLWVTTAETIGRLFRIDPLSGDREVVLSIPGSVGSGLRRGFIVNAADVPRDRDGDGVANGLDVCPDDADPGQEDLDGNGVGDLCNDSEDADGDEIANELDNCPDDANPGQEDLDRNDIGDACNDFEDRDGDDRADDRDGCPDDFNPTQIDTDNDDIQDACDPFPSEPDHEKGQLRVDLELAQDERDMCLARRFFEDADADGEEDSTDRCPETASGAAVDDAGCSRAQFCEAVSGSKLCSKADWRNDEPGNSSPKDCREDHRGKKKKKVKRASRSAGSACVAR